MCLAVGKKSHGFPVDEKNVLEIDNEAAWLLLHHAPKRINVFAGNLTADEEHRQALSANRAINSAAHFVLFSAIPSATRPDLTARPFQRGQASGQFQPHGNKRGRRESPSANHANFANYANSANPANGAPI